MGAYMKQEVGRDLELVAAQLEARASIIATSVNIWYSLGDSSSRLAPLNAQHLVSSAATQARHGHIIDSSQFVQNLVSVCDDVSVSESLP